MCFSAAASFFTAGVCAACATAAVHRCGPRRELPLAFMPLAFAIQQTIEGLLWLDLQAAPGMRADSSGLVLTFLLFALGWWPIHAPMAALLAERNGLRRKLMLPFAAAGVGLAVYLLWHMHDQKAGASIEKKHILYDLDFVSDVPWALAYLAIAVSPFLLSSHRAVRLLGAIVMTGAVVSRLVDREAFISIWCFFAAAASAVVILHFETELRQSQTKGLSR